MGGAFSETNFEYKGFFYFVFAYSLICHISLIFLIIPIKKTDGHNKLKMKNIDFFAAFLVITGCLLMILGLIEGGDNWKSSKAIAPLIVGFFTFMSALLYESLYIKKYQRKHENENKSSNWKLQIDLLFPPELLKIPNFYPFLIICGIYYATFVMQMSIGVQTYALIYHEPPIIAALKTFPISVGLGVGAFLYRDSYYRKVGYKKMFILSSVITLATVIWFSRTKFSIVNSYWKYDCIPLFLYGYGINIYFNIYFPCIISSTPLHLQGLVNGIFQTGSQLLLSVGNALVPSITGNLTIANTFEEKIAIQNKFRTVFYVIIGFHAFVVLLLVFVIKDTTKNTSEVSEEKVDETVDDNPRINNNNNNDNDNDLEKQEEVQINSESSIESSIIANKDTTVS